MSTHCNDFWNDFADEPDLNEHFLAIVNPAAGGGRSAKKAPSAIERLRQAGLTVEVRTTSKPTDATRLARQGFEEGYRRFLAGGGDGTGFEVINGALPASLDADEPIRLGFLPLGTGNAFLQDFTKDGPGYAFDCLRDDTRRHIDVGVLHHREGALYFINLMGFGFPVDVTLKAAGGLKRFGALGYILGVFLCLAGLRCPRLPVRLANGDLYDEPVVQYSVSNSRYTANGMLIAPGAVLDDGKLDFVTVAPMGRLQVIKAFPSLFTGKHVEHDRITALKSPSLSFETETHVDLMIDGEIRQIIPERIEVLPRALEIYA